MKAIIIITTISMLYGCSFSITDPRTGQTTYYEGLTAKTQPTKTGQSPKAPVLPKKLTPKEVFHKKANVLKPNEGGIHRTYPRIIEYKDQAGATRDQRAKSYQQHADAISKKGFICEKRLRPRPGAVNNNVVFELSNKWNYLSVICKQGCDNLYYSISAKRQSYFTYQGASPFPRLLVIGTQTMGMTQYVGLRFGKFEGGELKPISSNTIVDVIQWEQPFYGRGCDYKY